MELRAQEIEEGSRPEGSWVLLLADEMVSWGKRMSGKMEGNMA